MNIPGTNTSRHNALRIRRISEADLRHRGEVCLNAAKKWPSWRIIQQKGEPIYQKDSRLDKSLTQ
jgi:hypothetical protein